MRKLIPTVTLLSALISVGAVAQDHDNDWDKSQIKHVLLISIDGMHAVDFQNCMHGIAGSNNGDPVLPEPRGTGHNRRQLRRCQHIQALRLVSGADEHRDRRDSAHHGCLLRRGL